ncbi:MAG: cyclic-phosphate processing receiver domain-containing protein [Bacteroidota bacterium]
MKILLWLDDIRNPLEDNWLVFSPIEQPFEVVWMKTYKEFTRWITNNGLPTGICFDHDLSDFQAMKSGYPELMEDVDYPLEEKTGKDCANWLVEYCMDKNLKLPLYNIQSANPAGKENINSLLQNFIKHQSA